MCGTETLLDYWWEVTDRNGITSYYGKSKTMNAVDRGSVLQNGPIAHWALTETRDPYGNRVLYYYDVVSSNSGQQIYLSRINYTAHDSTGDGKYNIEFNLRNSTRNDINISGRYGFKEVTSKLLCNAIVKYDDEPLFAYLFITENKRESQYKSRLKDVYLFDSLSMGWNEYLNYCDSTISYDDEYDLTKPSIRYHFDYYDYPAAGNLFAPAVESTLPNSQVDNISSTFITSGFHNNSMGASTALGATKGKSWSAGGTATVGIGPVVCLTTLSLGANFDYSS